MRWGATIASLCLVSCSSDPLVEPPNQGAVQQTPQGQIIANLTSRGIAKDPRFNETSMIALYLYKKVDYSLSCTGASDPKKCEDNLVFRNEQVDALGFTNEPGYFGFEPEYGTYFPLLVADDGQNYPTTKPADPPGFPDPDVWQCIRVPFTTSPNYNKYECGVNFHPIRYFNRNLSTYTLQVYAATGRGYASSYILDYNLFNSLNHPVRDGDRYFAYFAVHFQAMKAAPDSEDRFDVNASTWKRPIEPDLVSPRIEIRVKMLPEGPYDKAGSVYDIPDYSTWYDPLAGCRPVAGTPGSVYFSEIQWMGSEDISGNAQTGDEFIELYNRSGNAINISGWQIEGAASGGGSLVLPLCATIPAGGVYTIGKYNDRAFTNLNYITPSLSLSNSGRNLVLKDASGTVIHSLTGCTSSWGSKGQNGGANAPKRSMRLDTVLKTLPYTSSACTASDWTTTSTGDSNYGTSSANVRSAYKANDDTSDGTVATPGYAGP